ncbi:unnamed protein product, partial [Mesorhabditis belari]|uniref:Cyclin-like domain-containing protein n=1 Tax=Mesorhabditis belari TaxID=2138241 RepID=A0AAF3FF79_9BILA
MMTFRGVTKDLTTFDAFWETPSISCSVPSPFADKSQDEESSDGEQSSPSKGSFPDLSNSISFVSNWESFNSATFVGMPPPPAKYSNERINASDMVDRRRKLQDTSITDSVQSIPPCPPKRSCKVSQVFSADFSTTFFHSTISSFSPLPETKSNSIGYNSQSSEFSHQRRLGLMVELTFDYGTHLCNPEDSILTYEILRQREISANAIKENFLQQLYCSMPGVAQVRRAVLRKMFVAVEDKEYNQETFHLAAYFLDVALSAMIPRTEETIFKMGAAALVLASKMEEYNPLHFSNVCGDGAHAITKVLMKELASFEKVMLAALRWRLEVATPYTFANFLHTVVQSSKEQILFAMYLLHHSLLNDQCRRWKSYLTAHAAIIVAHVLIPTTKTKYYCAEVLLNLVVKQLHPTTMLRLDSVREICLHLIETYETVVSARSTNVSLPPISEWPICLRADFWRIARTKKELKTKPLLASSLSQHTTQDMAGSEYLYSTISEFDQTDCSELNSDEIDMDQTSDLIADATHSFQDPFDF